MKKLILLLAILLPSLCWAEIKINEPISGAAQTALDAKLALTGGTVTGSVLVDGNTTLGDASGDTVTINAGTVTAANATDVSSTRLANVGALDDRYLSITSLLLAKITQFPSMNQWQLSSSSGTGASISDGPFYADLRAGTATGSYSYKRIQSISNLSFGNETGNQGTGSLSLTKRIRYVLRIGWFNTLDGATNSIYWRVGDHYTFTGFTTSNAFPSRSFGVRITGDEMKLVYCDGTESMSAVILDTTTVGITIPNAILVLDYDGDGTITATVFDPTGTAIGTSRSISGVTNMPSTPLVSVGAFNVTSAETNNPRAYCFGGYFYSE